MTFLFCYARVGGWQRAAGVLRSRVCARRSDADGEVYKSGPTEMNIYGSAVRCYGNDAPVSTFCSCRLAHLETSPLLAGVSFSS